MFLRSAIKSGRDREHDGQKNKLERDILHRYGSSFHVPLVDPAELFVVKLRAGKRLSVDTISSTAAAGVRELL